MEDGEPLLGIGEEQEDKGKLGIHSFGHTITLTSQKVATLDKVAMYRILKCMLPLLV